MSEPYNLVEKPDSEKDAHKKAKGVASGWGFFDSHSGRGSRGKHRARIRPRARFLCVVCVRIHYTHVESNIRGVSASEH